MKHIIQNTLLICSMTFTTALTAQAQLLTTEKGMEKIKTNLDNSKKNKIELDLNFVLLKNNVSEVQRVKETVNNQKKSVSGEIAKSAETLKKLTAQEKEINNLIVKETEKLNLETKQIAQLQALIEQLRKNQEQRQLIISDYQNQLKSAGLSIKSWNDREAQLREQDKQSTEALHNISTEESNWLGKKSKLEVELKRWNAETEKQQKIYDTYQALLETK